MAHGMGALVAAEMVERAITFQLLELDLSYQHLKTCPAQLPELGSILVTLNLSNNRLTGLPDDLSNLCCVEELFLQYNCLMKLPESIGCMTRLYELDVKNNRLVALPASIGNLTCLAILNTTNNVLTSVPPSLGRVIKLQELCLHSNRLKDLPENVCKLKDLESLYLGENRLECLPFKIGHFRQMTEMDVSGCELRQLPNSICDCVSLKKLWVCSNRLMGLPAQMGRLVNLKELHVRRNQIRAFPASLARLHVYTFTAYNNPLLDEYNKLGLQRLTKEPKDDLPPLLELSARAVYNHGIEHNTGCIPQELEALLSSVRICSSCGGPFFFHFRSNVFFHTVGVFHRVPLLQQLCSPLGNKKCVPLESKR
ncbi:leucine-rich repeat-containing protein 40-like [Corticium candelabrum]|uniref:leucine-rich repeat-containing protein 40-like n=1 Tax=Corticium candelabrum TaxID=121492 RepID=UPI002E26FF51|nr:leucine-rich repeat-containing protein 40-like [Corticium candelabrum]